jgi:hypothetical protein
MDAIVVAPGSSIKIYYFRCMLNLTAMLVCNTIQDQSRFI